jgi:hypothetical protein
MSARGRHDLFMVQVFGSSLDLRRCRRDVPATVAVGGNWTVCFEPIGRRSGHSRSRKRPWTFGVRRRRPMSGPYGKPNASGLGREECPILVMLTVGRGLMPPIGKLLDPGLGI